jgi:hypothetical protein
LLILDQKSLGFSQAFGPKKWAPYLCQKLSYCTGTIFYCALRNLKRILINHPGAPHINAPRIEPETITELHTFIMKKEKQAPRNSDKSRENKLRNGSPQPISCALLKFLTASSVSSSFGIWCELRINPKEYDFKGIFTP